MKPRAPDVGFSQLHAAPHLLKFFLLFLLLSQLLKGVLQGTTRMQIPVSIHKSRHKSLSHAWPALPLVTLIQSAQHSVSDIDDLPTDCGATFCCRL